MSLVEQLPSTSSRSNVVAVAALRAARSASGLATASVVMTQSIVASDGASIPAPLAIAPTVQLSWCSATCLGTVSVVMMARAASSPPVSPPAISWTTSRTPARTLSIGSRSPIRPVEHTATSIAPVSVPQSDSAAAVASAVAWVSWKPSGPVQALAPPEFRTTARSRPVVRTCCDHSTGAALTLFRVKIPAAVWSGPSLKTSARSSVPEALMPAEMPVARNPAGAVTPWVRSSRVMGPLRPSRDRRFRASPGRGSSTARRRPRCL